MPRLRVDRLAHCGENIQLASFSFTSLQVYDNINHVLPLVILNFCRFFYVRLLPHRNAHFHLIKSQAKLLFPEPGELNLFPIDFKTANVYGCAVGASKALCRMIGGLALSVVINNTFSQ